MKVSLVIETANADGDAGAVATLLRNLAPQTDGVEVIVTCTGPSSHGGARVVTLPPDATYYEHKNAGFAAATGDVVAFVDADCQPSPRWLSALIEPFARGARVVAGATSYPGRLAPLGNQLDFPYFDVERRPFGASAASPPTVLNFFANNVAFARDAFPGYPKLPSFKGACQVLALELSRAGVPITFAPDARVTHAWPDDALEWLQTRLLRGADTTQLIPHVLAAHAPALRRATSRLGPLPALALFGVRALRASWAALRGGPALRGLALVAGVTAVDTVGALAAPAVYRWAR